MAESELHHAAAEVSEALPPRDCWAVARGGVLVHEQYAFCVLDIRLRLRERIRNSSTTDPVSPNFFMLP